MLWRPNDGGAGSLEDRPDGRWLFAPTHWVGYQETILWRICLFRIGVAGLVIRYQRQQLDRSSTFADIWQRALWQNPDVDYTLQRPVSTIGKRAWLDNRMAERQAAMQRIALRYGVFYFYAQSCAACEIQSPILKSISDSNHFSVVAVSMDGGPNRVFPNYVVDSGQRERMGLAGRATPALVLFDTVTKQPIPIGTGLMAADEIMDRIFILTNTKPGSDF